jgi:hypothetical protein
MVDRSRKERARLTLLLGLCVAIPARGWAEPSASEVPATRTEDRVIFDRAASRKWMSDGAKGEFWTPALADVLALENKLPAFLREPHDHENPRKEPLWKRAPRYKRQYLGLVRRGQRVIFGNFFCNVPSTRADDWRAVLVSVHDGGDCYFTVEYDVKRGTFHDLTVNGEA